MSTQQQSELRGIRPATFPPDAENDWWEVYGLYRGNGGEVPLVIMTGDALRAEAASAVGDEDADALIEGLKALGKGETKPIAQVRAEIAARLQSHSQL